MAYIIPNDLLQIIQTDQLNQLQTGDNILPGAIDQAEAEVRSHLIQKYNIDAELRDLTLFDITKQYYASDRVYTVSGTTYTYYYGAYPYPLFNLYAQYKTGDNVFYNGHNYKALKDSIIPTADIQYGTYQNIPPPNVFPGNPEYWQDLGTYAIPIGTLLTNATYWTLGDNRDAQLKMYMCDIAAFHMHSRISPNNVPGLRERRYMGKDEDRSIIKGRLYFPEYSALGWLQGAGEGRLTPNLARIQPVQGTRIRWGGQIKNQNDY